jgi:hypothetical protein
VFFDFTGTNLQIKWTDHDGTIPIDYLLENNFNKFKDKERHSWIRKPVSGFFYIYFIVFLVKVKSQFGSTIGERSTIDYILYNNYRNMGGSHKQGRGLIIRRIKQHHVSEGLINLYYILYNNYRNMEAHINKDED